MPTVDHDLLQELQKLRAEHEALVRQRRELDAAIARVMARIGGQDPGAWMGSLEHLGMSISAEEIDEARRQMWRFADDKSGGNGDEEDRSE